MVSYDTMKVIHLIKNYAEKSALMCKIIVVEGDNDEKNEHKSGGIRGV